MTNEEVLPKVQNIIADQLDKNAEDVTLTTNFKNDLDADSLDIFEIINEIEDEFDVKIETDESIETVADLVNFITERTEA
ncbi:acyl carrier protein [Lacticaseibacillus casei]|jgi:acyl carrier protein|uniref:Acyl carrier protein n=1 Tax=Lacticaseibacillus huelsenbergensis TaxID=3035291 RepID=A0ABY8DUS1_9LACO|nr:MULTISPECIES: acyl carrier protein [Lacticaseibacillus]MDG3060969.1 acyl carrier protein [Lacticaseibacillus sp. BCRC 81376]QVI37254.1 acyl carrier protein [Lacticaseibacillus casei]QXG59046.1 acyl carrier protein [Lacticaseibacillus casei]WFB39507.1 acyl carrier protein [Lacticaseibacillus huelsenbergensis]WFB41209.1 acyl carrier protein [Lacticaseibacillus huelsenbergensis]